MSSSIRCVAATVVAVGLLGLPGIATLRQDVTLRHRWTRGETLRYRIVQQTTTTVSGLPGGGEMNIDQSSTQVIRAIAEDVAADGTTRLVQSVESVKMEMTSPMFTMGYDSENPDVGDNPMSATLKSMMSAMIGESFTLVMTPTGEVQKVEGMTQLAEKMFKDVPQSPETAGVFAGLKANVSDEAMRSMFMQGFAQFPNRPVKPGDTWKTAFKTSIPMLGGIVTSVTSTLKSVDGEGSSRGARIVTSLASTQDAAKPAQANPMGLLMQVGEASGEGEQLFDAATGRLRRSTGQVTFPMTMSGTAPDGTALSMKTSSKTKTTVELIESLDPKLVHD